ncbi:MAG: hypothetical protein ACPG06_05580 [Alphaproteobacteria bacterium]
MGDTASIAVTVTRPRILVAARSSHHALRLETPRQVVVDANRLMTITGAETKCHITLGGTQGPAGVAIRVRLLELGEDIEAHRAVYVGSDGKAYAADAQAGEGIRALVGILMRAGLAGDVRAVQQRDEIEIPSATFLPDRCVVVAENGGLTQGKPAGLQWHAPIGRALSPTRIEIDIDTPIERIL